MFNLDYNDLTMGVEKRLDEIFADDLQSRNSQEDKLKFVKPPSLVGLRNIIMTLEWEVTDDHLKDLMQELSKLQRTYIKDHLLQKLLGLLFYLARYIRVYQSDTHPYIFKMLVRTYNGLAKIASGKYPNHQKTKIVNDEIKRYLSLKSYLKRKNKKNYRQTVSKINTLEKSLSSPIDAFSKQKPYPSKDASKIHYRNLNNDLRELKKFIHLEIKKLREDLQRILALISEKHILAGKYSRFGTNNLD
jgi:hypothetical protein